MGSSREESEIFIRNLHTIICVSLEKLSEVLQVYASQDHDKAFLRNVFLIISY